MTDIEFIDGLIVKEPHEKAPDFVKGRISIKVEDLGKWLRQKYQDGEEWVNADIKVSKGGNWYVSVDNWKPEQNPRQEEAAAEAEAQPDFNDSVPF